MTYQPSDYETARRSLRRKLLPGILILVILAICVFLMLERNNAPGPPHGQTSTTAAPPTR